MVRRQAVVVPRLAPLFCRDPDPVGARRISCHLLLLPRSLLQGLLGGPALMRGGGAAQVLSWRAIVALNPAELSSLLSLPRVAVPRAARNRRLAGLLVQRPFWC